MQVQTGELTFQAGAALAAYLRVKISASKLAAAGATDEDIGVLRAAVTAANDYGTVVPKNMAGTVRMIAGEAISQFGNVYGYAGGKVGDTVNENFIGIALTAATADGDEIEVLRQVQANDLENLGAIDGNLVIDEDFIGDWPAAGTALSGQGAYAWTKTETDGLGVISSDEANGVLKFSADAVAEVAVGNLFMENSPVDIDDDPIFECILAVYDIGDAAAVDIDFGLASDDHATDFESIACFAAFHLDGNDLSLKAHSDDGTTDTAAVDSLVDLVDNTYYAFKIDCSNKSDVKFYYRALGATAWTQICAATTFDIDQYTGTLTPIVMVEKTSDDTTFDVRVDRIRVQAQRSNV